MVRDLRAQGMLAFHNRTQAGDAPVYWPDGTGPGARAVAGLYLVTGGNSLSLIATSPFVETERLAYFIDSQIVTVSGIAAGQPATFRVRVWETSAGSYENAIATGAVHGEFPTVNGNNEVTIELGDGRNFVPGLIGLLPFTLVPEPSPISIFVAASILVYVSKRSSRRGDHEV